MEETFTYQCSSCGQIHNSWPALTFNSPSFYHALSENEKQEIAELDSDFCIITHPDHTYRFIRCTFEQLVTDHCQNLEYGVWVSLSEESFQDYEDNFNNESHTGGYFGWLSNSIPDYIFKDSIPLNVTIQGGNLRPKIEPHSSFKHPFVHDFYNGITKAEAENRINNMLNPGKR